MAWQAAAAGFTAAYNLYNFDQQYNQGRLANFVRNRRRRNPSQTMPRGMAIYSKRRRTDGNVRGGDAVGVGGAYVNDIHYKRKRTLGKVNIRKLAKQGTTAIYDRWQRMGRFANTGGQLYLSRLDAVTKAMDGTTNLLNSPQGLPLYMWDVTSCVNSIGGAYTYPVCAWRALKISNGSIVFNGVPSEAIATGALGTNYGTANWQYYDTSKPVNAVESPVEQGLLDWVRIQMVVWGPKKASCKVWVELCQIDEFLQPQCSASAQASTTSLPTAYFNLNTEPLEGTKNQDLYYTNMFTRLIDSPFGTYTKETRPMTYKVLDRKVLEFSPVASFEENGTALAHKKTLNQYIKFGRKCNFAWNNDIPPSSTTLGDSVLETQVNRGQHDCYVHPKARVFLRVYSDTMQSTGESVFTNPEDGAPSFDIRISRKWIISE